MPDSDTLVRFERTIVPHLNAAYNLARWLMRNGPDAEDVVQEAYLRAFRFFDTFQGTDGRAWLLAIVRNSCRTALEQSTVRTKTTELDDGRNTLDYATSNPDPEALLLRQADIDSVRACIDDLPFEYREVVVLRELEQLSYKEIATAASVPVGTVMSRLARARSRLQECLAVRVRGAKA